MFKVFTRILPCGILPALSQHISRASELGIFENQYCLGCLSRDSIPETLLDLNGFEVLSLIFPMFPGQSFFEVLSNSHHQNGRVYAACDDTRFIYAVCMYLYLTFGSD